MRLTIHRNFTLRRQTPNLQFFYFYNALTHATRASAECILVDGIKRAVRSNKMLCSTYIAPFNTQRTTMFGVLDGLIECNIEACMWHERITTKKK